MGAANIFCSAVDALLEDTVAEATGGTLATQQIKHMLFIARPRPALQGHGHRQLPGRDQRRCQPRRRCPGQLRPPGHDGTPLLSRRAGRLMDAPPDHQPTHRHRDAGHGARLLRAWQRLAHVPAGRWIFSRLVGRMAPYTGSLGARVERLEPGRAVVTLRDRRRVRNHLRSVHAIALANLGELATGLAMTSAMPPGMRGIPVAIHIDYLKKARGTLTCDATAGVPEIKEPTSHDVTGDIRDAAGDVVASIRVSWQLEHVT
jgi:acyl-coenzyme A thioesterase PaaI-like protein